MLATLLPASPHSGYGMIGSALSARGTPGGAAAAAPSITTVLVGGVIAVVLVLGVWSLVGHVITIAHEGAHAVAAVLLGGRITEVRLNRDLTGSTRWANAVLQLPVAAAGYLGPSAFGLVGSVLIVHGRSDAVLWISLVLLGLLLLSTANWFGRFAVVLTGAALFLTLQQGSAGVRVVVACAWVWLLLIGGLLHVWNHRHGGADFADLRRMTFVVPPFVWAGFALLVASFALVVGGAWLVGAATPPF
jgi:hypothetical protein